MSSDSARSYSDPDGPFRASQIREGDPYELSNGHPIRCMSAGERHGKANAQGTLALGTDPGIQGRVGTDVGIEFNNGKNLRAPDLVLGIEGAAGWSKKIPPVCVEYADRGQDEEQLKQKISELLEAGVRHIWVVRLSGPLRVEAYEPGKKMQLVDADGVLEAPGVLVNRYTPRELVDQEAALRAAFRNQLQTLGYESLEAVRAEGMKAGRDEGLTEEARAAVHEMCEVLGISATALQREQVEQMDLEALRSLRLALRRQRRWPQD